VTRDGDHTLSFFTGWQRWKHFFSYFENLFVPFFGKKQTNKQTTQNKFRERISLEVFFVSLYNGEVLCRGSLLPNCML